MNYIEFVNKTVREIVSSEDQISLFGQNITAGSCISGLTSGLKVNERSMIINTTNSENTLVGMGFGLMLNGINSIFFMKQLDFLFLGIDHLVNTFNYIRTIRPKSSFTIVTVVVDSGYEGIMASTNNLGDFSTISKTQGYTITNKIDSKYILENYLVSPGFRVIAVSQRLFKKDILLGDFKNNVQIQDGIFKYKSGNDLTIVCFNFSFPQAIELSLKFEDKGYSPSLFSVSRVMHGDYSMVIKDLEKTNGLIIVDDSKSNNKLFYELLIKAHEKENSIYVDKIVRDLDEESYAPNSDIFKIDCDRVIARYEMHHND